MLRLRHLRALQVFAIALGALALSQIASAQLPVIEREQRLRLPPDAAPEPPANLPVQFGRRVFTDGQTTLVTVDRGRAAYAYAKNPNGRWRYQAALAAPEGLFTAKGGAIRGDIALVQAFTEAGSQDRVLVFHRSQGQWSLTQTITGGSSNPGNDENFLAIGSDFIAIGSPSYNGAQGGVIIYDAVGSGAYTYATTLQVAGTDAGFLTGFNPQIEGNTLVVATPGTQTINVFDRTGGVWTETASLGNPTTPATVQFAFSGNRVLITSEQTSPEDRGKPKIYVRVNGAWTLEQELDHPYDPQGRLGRLLAMDGRRIVIEAWAPDDNQVFVYQRTGSVWSAVAQLGGAEPVTCIVQDPSGTRGALAIAGRTAFWGCGATPTPNPEFEGKVLVYRLPAVE